MIPNTSINKKGLLLLLLSYQKGTATFDWSRTSAHLAEVSMGTVAPRLVEAPLVLGLLGKGAGLLLGGSAH